MKRKRIAALLLALVLCLGLLPVTALAAGASVSWNVSGYPIGLGEDEEGEDHGQGPFSITFMANGGKFSDGSEQKSTMTTDGPAEGMKHKVQFPEDPTREGYHFDGWYTDGTFTQLVDAYMTAGATVVAKWDPSPNTPKLYLDPNGGTCSVEYVELSLDGHTAPTLDKELPVPTRSGYTFDGWFVGGTQVQVGGVFSGGETAVAKWTKVRTSKTTPSLKVTPDKIEAGAEKVEILLSCATDDAALDWRPLERALYGDGKPSDAETAVKSYISGKFGAVGLRLTSVKYQYDIPVKESAYPAALYPEGVYPTTGLVLTLEGAAMSGTLRLDLAPQLFVQLVDKDDDTVLDASSADIFNAAQVSIPVGTANPNGPFTVKFNLNYKNPPEKEIPEDQKLSRGQTVDLPDGKKLTSPYTSHEFYAWCLLGDDGKLYPWKETNPVTADMTLYAGWVKKGTAVKDGQALPEATEPSKPAQNPAATVVTDFHDVPANSPFLDSIVWAVKQGITNGKTATTFGPGDPCTRAQIVTFLWRAAGSPEPKLTETQYVDVTDPGAYYYKAVQWAAELDMEYSGTFDPHDTCSRVAAVYFIWTAFGRPESTAKASFEDVQEPERGQWYWPDLPDAVDWAVEKGVTTGKTATTFGPGDPCTRGQIVTFLYRAYVK